MKRVIGQRDSRLAKNKDKAEIGTKKAEAEASSELIRSVYVNLPVVTAHLSSPLPAYIWFKHQKVYGLMHLAYTNYIADPKCPSLSSTRPTQPWSRLTRFLSTQYVAVTHCRRGLSLPSTSWILCRLTS